MEIKKEIAKEIAKFYKIDEESAEKTVVESKKGMGDYSSTIAFMLAKKLGKDPKEIAGEFKTKNKLFARVEVVNGYINFYLSEEYYENVVKERVKKRKKIGKKVIVEFPSVNPNKPWHVGHLRNALLGNSIANIYEYLGYDVERMDYIDDLGLQFAQSLYSYLEINKKVEGKIDHWLGKEYVNIAKSMEENKEVENKVRETLVKMERGEIEEARWLAEECVRAQYETAFKFGIFHNVLVFESNIMRNIFEKGMEMLKKSNALEYCREGKNAGCYIFKSSQGEKILIRSDGTATYTGKDVIFALWKFGKIKGIKFEKFIKQPNGKTAYKSSEKGKEMRFGNADTVINVIGIEQKFPQQVIKEILAKFGISHYHHLAYAHVRLESERFSGRKGIWVGYTADELFEEGMKKVKEKTKDEKTAKAIVNAAIKFAFLRIHSEKEVLFDWERALSTEGDSGPYLLYSYVRAVNILNKIGKMPKDDAYKYNEDERFLIKELGRFDEVVENGARNMDPHVIADYLLELAKLFHSFYSKYRVLQAEEGKLKRILLVKKFSEILKDGLGLLGIEVVEKM
ncbi:MAG: arginine--tRNA ligase [Candidatus Anstonellales archaeon]